MRELHEYTVTAYGRKRGAIGMWHFLGPITIRAQSPEAARLALYEHWEHLSDVRITEKQARKD